MKKIFISIVLLLYSFIAFSQEYNFSPLYFGPNALPVTDMLDGTTSEKIYAEVAYDYFKGFYGDRTNTFFAKLNLPLFTPRVNLSVWMPVIEFYKNTESSFAHQQPLKRQNRGKEVGNVYVSTDIHVFKQRRITPDVTLRIGLITASGDGEQCSRFFDAPGYFFDTSIAKSIPVKNGFVNDLRFVLNLGFLCWQVATSSQNDAYMYGLKGILNTKAFNFSVSYQGYSGWIGNGDKPMVIKTDLVGKYKGFRPILAYEYGLRDFPYNHLRVGLGYVF